jgi:hypothetical protein
MSIISQTYGLLGQDGVTPRRIQLVVTDDLATLLEPGYLNENNLVPSTVYATDIVDCFYLYNKMTQTGTYGEFFVTIEPNGVIVLSLLQAGGLKFWTPTISFTTPSDLAVVYSSQVGGYILSGNVVLVNFDLTFTPTYTTSSGVFEIKGFPFSCISATFGSLISSNILLSAGYTFLTLASQTNQTFFNIYQNGSGEAISLIETTQVPSGTLFQLQGTISFPI